MFAPLALFVYARPDHTRRTVEALLRNQYASDTDLFIFCDAPRTSVQESSVAEVRSYVDKIQGFNSLYIYHRPYNYGLAQSIIHGVSSIIEQYGRVIVLEDDMVTSPFFLRYMNEALDKYFEDNRVISIHGYVYPVKQKLPEAFFLRGADCWGWATWSRGWGLFNPDGRKLLKELRRRKLNKAFDFDGTSAYTKMLEGQINGKNDSWAVRWYASAFLAGKLTLYPGRSLVHNIGNDSSGTHCNTTNKMDVELSPIAITLDNVVVEESIEARAIFKQFFNLSRKSKPFRVLKSKIVSTLRQSMVTLAKVCLPSLLLRKIRRLFLRDGVRIIFDGPFATWDDAVQYSSGYDTDQILEKVFTAALKVKHGEAIYERDSVIFDKIQYSWPVTAGLMRAAACCGGKLSVLDFGGSFGSSFFQNCMFLDGLQHVHWSVVEQPHFAKKGQEFIQDNQLFFYESVAEAIDVEKPNVVLLSSVLQYLKDPYRILDELVDCGADIILIDRTPFHQNQHDIILVQKTGKKIYQATYPFRVFSHQNIINCLSPYFDLLSEDVSPEGYLLSRGLFSYNFLLFERRHP